MNFPIVTRRAPDHHPKNGSINTMGTVTPVAQVNASGAAETSRARRPVNVQQVMDTA